MTHPQDTTPANPTPPGWPDPLESPQAEAIRNGKLDDTEIRNLFDCMERELRLHRERAANPAQGVSGLLLKAAEMAERSAALNEVYQAREKYLRFAQDCRAAIGAGGQAVGCVACEDNPKAPNIPCTVCGRSHPAPSGQAVAGEVLDVSYLLDDNGKPLEVGGGDVLAVVEGIPNDPVLAFTAAWNACREATIANPPAQPGWRCESFVADYYRPARCINCDARREDHAASPLPGWRDMDSAPKDGTKIQVWADGYEWPEVIYYERYDDATAVEAGTDGYWRYADDLFADVAEVEVDTLNCWQPIPAAPLPGGAK